MKADLHVHSHFSDGTSSPEELLALALKHQLTDLAVVDHDTLAGIEQLQKIFAPTAVNFIAGIEMSAFDFKRQRKVHILGYQLTNPDFVNQLCEPLLQARTQNTLLQLEKIQQAGFDITEKQVRTSAKNATALYKQHIMAALIESGDESEIYGALYQVLFKNQGVAHFDIPYIDVYDAVEAINLGGGKAVVAHPGQLDSFELITELVSSGIVGIEKYHPDHTLVDQNKVQALLDAYQLQCFGGSDYHGGFGPDFLGKSGLTKVNEFPRILR
ncbi:MAG: PHP domain-containing protein [Enterococcus sp.]